MIDYEQYEDKQLIALLREENPISNRAFNVLYKRYARHIKAYCLFKAENQAEAEDVFQETWLNFIKAVKDGNINIILPNFIVTICKNLFYNIYRKKNKGIINRTDNIEELLGKLADPINAQKLYENNDFMSILTVAVNNLPEKYKEVLVLRWFSELSFEEIAKTLGESHACVRMRHSRAIDELAKLLRPIVNELTKWDSK